jgi:hypothetical protein
LDHFWASSAQAFGQFVHPRSTLDPVFTALSMGSAAAGGGAAMKAATIARTTATNRNETFLRGIVYALLSKLLYHTPFIFITSFLSTKGIIGL